jgi:CRISPR/Cas system CSM-associated protein Csm4 (group 5 of RAMP superfamily)
MLSPIKVKILEDWYVIDSILFNDHAKKVIKEAKKFEQYISLKGAFLSSLFEYYNHIKYVPKYEIQPTSVKTLTEAAQKNAIFARKMATNIMAEARVREALKKKIVREGRNTSNMDKFADKVIKEKFTQLALDNALIGIPVIEATMKTACDDFTGQMLEDSYKQMRTAIIRLAKTCTKV